MAIASSLSDVMADIREEFLKQYPYTQITFNTASSGVLAKQIQQNAPVDIFASADIELVKNLVPSQDIEIFAQNQLVLATSTASAITIQSLEELDNPEIQTIALGNPNSVPAGKYAQIALGRSPLNLDLYQRLQEQNKLVFGENVRQVLAYLESQVAEVGFIYQTDLQQSQKVKSLLTLDSALTGEINLAIAIVNPTAEKLATREFIDFTLSGEGQKVIEQHGFLPIKD